MFRTGLWRASVAWLMVTKFASVSRYSTHRLILVSDSNIVDTWSHPYLTAVQSESVFAELWYTVSPYLTDLQLTMI